MTKTILKEYDFYECEHKIFLYLHEIYKLNFQIELNNSMTLLLYFTA